MIVRNWVWMVCSEFWPASNNNDEGTREESLRTPSRPTTGLELILVDRSI